MWLQIHTGNFHQNCVHSERTKQVHSTPQGWQRVSKEAKLHDKYETLWLVVCWYSTRFVQSYYQPYKFKFIKQFWFFHSSLALLNRVQIVYGKSERNRVQKSPCEIVKPKKYKWPVVDEGIFVEFHWCLTIVPWIN